MKKYSILSVDSNPDYLFFVPITCAFWKKLGYTPYVTLVDKDINPKLIDLVSGLAEGAGGIIRRMPYIEGYRTCNVAQISRLYAAADPLFKDDDYLITDDMDKFVISPQWFNQQDFSKDIHIYDPDELNYTRLKIGNIGMSASVWKEVIGVHPGTVRENLERVFEEMLPKESSWDHGWNLDEYILTTRVFNSVYYPGKCQMLERGANHLALRNGRIDRSFWKETLFMYLSSRIIDVHLGRNPYEDDMWNDIKLIMSTVFSKEEIDLYEKYKQDFVKIVEE